MLLTLAGDGLLELVRAESLDTSKLHFAGRISAGGAASLLLDIQDSVPAARVLRSVVCVDSLLGTAIAATKSMLPSCRSHNPP